MRCLSLLLVCFLCLPGLRALDLPAPDPLVFNNGEPVRSAADWSRRRLELLQVLQDVELGHLPPAPGRVTGRELRNEVLLDGRVRYRLVHLSFGKDGALGFDVALFSAVSAQGPLPAIVHLSFEATPGAEPLPVLPHPPGQGKGVDALAPVDPLPAATPGPSSLKPVSPEAAARRYLPALERGYLIAAYHYQDTGEDTTLRLPDGSWAFRRTRFFPAYPEQDWGLIAAWAWGVSRCIDYLETDASVDRARIAAIGHSRLGKAILVAGALDPRIAVSLPAGSGAGGTQLFRFCGEGRGGSEGLDIELRKYPNWFGPGMLAFKGGTGRLPLDQHFLIALTAPRPLLSLEGSEDQNCVPYALSQALDAAAPVYALLGAPAGALAAHHAPHRHELAPADWSAALDGLDRFWHTSPAPFSVSSPAISSLPSASSPNSAAPVHAAASRVSLNVRDFGAKGDGQVLDTAALQAALDACGSAPSGGTVLVPAGHYLTGSLELHSNTVLQLAAGSVLEGSSDLAQYPLTRVRWEGRWVEGHRALLYARQAAHLAVVGEGRLVLPASLGGRDMPRRPALIEPIDCQDLRFEGFQASYHRMWGLHPTLCDDLVVRGLTIRSIGGNSDGVDVDSCRHVLIERCDIDSGDDCIALKSGRGMEGYTEARPTTDVLIRDCSFADRNFACIGIGSEASGGIRGVRIERCHFTYARTHAIYIKSRIGRGAYIEDVRASDLVVDTAPNGFLRINLLRSGIQDPSPVEGEEGIPHGGDFEFRNIEVHCGPLVEATEIDPARPLDGLRLEHIRGDCSSGMGFANIRNLILRDINVGGAHGPLVTTERIQGGEGF